jgi:hypothetical protein
MCPAGDFVAFALLAKQLQGDLAAGWGLTFLPSNSIRLAIAGRHDEFFIVGDTGAATPLSAAQESPK